MAGADKEDLRSELGQERRLLAEIDIAAARSAVRTAVLRRFGEVGWRSAAAYVPLRTEPGSVELLDELVASGVRVIVPVVLHDRDLDWTHWGQSDPLGVGAVAGVDVVLVPALAVAHDGTRLGRGGGSYDRALARVRPGTPIAALLYSDELYAELPRDEWDIPVTAVVTPQGWRDVPTPGWTGESPIGDHG